MHGLHAYKDAIDHAKIFYWEKNGESITHHGHHDILNKLHLDQVVLQNISSADNAGCLAKLAVPIIKDVNYFLKHLCCKML